MNHLHWRIGVRHGHFPNYFQQGCIRFFIVVYKGAGSHGKDGQHGKIGHRVPQHGGLVAEQNHGDGRHEGDGHGLPEAV
ncbi:MAG: hypothetical protein IPN76_17960 [Saprospiraceae bacterium]|nr:hypothetical protein [Saprospiraceae bacterium]